MNLPTLITFAVGGLLIYSAVKNKDPRDVVKDSFKPKPVSSIGGAVGANVGTIAGATGPVGPVGPQGGTDYLPNPLSP